VDLHPLFNNDDNTLYLQNKGVITQTLTYGVDQWKKLGEQKGEVSLEMEKAKMEELVCENI
jgi:hypothetical protein